MSKSVAEILNAAADLIEPEGAWLQGDLRGLSNGEPVCWCAMGALIHVGRSAAWGVIRLLEAGMPNSPGYMLRPLVRWNDTPGRTQAEVVAKLREAAKLAEGRQP